MKQPDIQSNYHPLDLSEVEVGQKVTLARNAELMLGPLGKVHIPAGEVIKIIRFTENVIAIDTSNRIAMTVPRGEAEKILVESSQQESFDHLTAQAIKQLNHWLTKIEQIIIRPKLATVLNDEDLPEEEFPDLGDFSWNLMFNDFKYLIKPALEASGGHEELIAETEQFVTYIEKDLAGLQYQVETMEDINKLKDLISRILEVLSE